MDLRYDMDGQKDFTYQTPDDLAEEEIDSDEAFDAEGD